MLYTVKKYILYEDSDIIVCDKPTLLLSVPGRLETNKDCLITRLQTHGFPDALIVHRLDFETSGIIVLATNKQAHRNLSIQFQNRLVYKEYRALVYGRINSESGAISLPLRYDEPTKPRHVVDEDFGKHSLTYYQVLERSQYNTKLKLIPYTGRSHQLRVHCLHLGFPILGDSLYAHANALQASSRLCLHSYLLKFMHPTSQQLISFTSKDDFPTA